MPRGPLTQPVRRCQIYKRPEAWAYVLTLRVLSQKVASNFSSPKISPSPLFQGGIKILRKNIPPLKKRGTREI